LASDPILIGSAFCQFFIKLSISFLEYHVPVNLLLLLQKSNHVGDKCWRVAKRMVNFPEYQYTCIGYSSGNTEGRGSGVEFNDKILPSVSPFFEKPSGTSKSPEGTKKGDKYASGGPGRPGPP
jgi:hypothetical protein